VINGGRHHLAALALLLVAVLAAEAAARADDWIRFGMSPLSYPDNGVDLRIADSNGVRGRPRGRYQQFVLNNFGFRSQRDHSLVPVSGCIRVMTLGASETLGLLEPPGEEFPAQLERQLLAGGGCYEVLNAAVAGMSLPAIRYSWVNYWSRFEPDFVVVYPSPVFYLGDRPPQDPRPSSLNSASRPWPQISLKPRLVHRAKEAIEFPAIIQRRRVHQSLARSLRAIDADSVWDSVPQDRLQQYAADLSALVAAVAAAGATPVILTHAHRSSEQSMEADKELLLAWRTYSPRAEIPVLLAFESAAASATRALAGRKGIRIVDVDRCLSGHPEFFGDQVHFTVEGSRRVAALTAHALVQPPMDASEERTTSCTPFDQGSR